ncbi:two-component system sensor histidine kinase EvgS [Pseudomonas lini]|uniref:transporter substrate-binding domain-containing protein n=1 Tax=Pseudomonas lini TaxID=163011 RepID=UPI00278926EA|nr:transporter substrate-binding domain-containing protein [Pseudomonas lini]MDQ0125306.1 two-component system sensor histidine kinase EvgS [Pseudomonas lini]
MPFFKGLKPAACWMCLLGAMGVAHWVMAAYSATPESKGAIAGTTIRLNAQELQWIAENPRVIVASKQYPLYLFKDEQGQWSGLYADVLTRISAMTGLQFVHEETFSTEQMLEQLESGSANMSTTLSMNDERKGFLDFSHAFGGAGWVLIGRAGEPPLKSLDQLSRRVLVLPARHALESMIRRDYPAIHLHSVKTYAEARALVEIGEADATIYSEIGAHVYPSGQLRVGNVVEGKWDADYLALGKGQPQLLSILNKALEAFSPAELRAIRLKWSSGSAPLQAPAPWQPLTTWGWGSGGAIGIFALSILWHRRLKAMTRQRRAAETDLREQLAFQHALMDAMPDPMFVRDLEGRLVMCNKSYEESLSTRFDQVQGRQLIELDILPRETAELLHAEVMAHLGTRKASFCERRLLFKSGPRDIYQWAVPFYSADGTMRGLLGGWCDIGKYKKQA